MSMYMEICLGWLARGGREKRKGTEVWKGLKFTACIYIGRQCNETHQSVWKGGKKERDEYKCNVRMNLFKVHRGMYGIITMKSSCIVNVCY
jgi:hypothetical protein